VHLDLLTSSSARLNAVATAAVTDHPKLSAILSSTSMQRSVSQVQAFIECIYVLDVRCEAAACLMKGKRFFAGWRKRHAELL
jgi:hypothetical protein